MLHKKWKGEEGNIVKEKPEDEEKQKREEKPEDEEKQEENVKNVTNKYKFYYLYLYNINGIGK